MIMGQNALRHFTGGGLIWDNHACLPLEPGGGGQMEALARCREAGVDIVSINVASGDQAPRDAVFMLADFRAWVRAHPETMILVERPLDALRARRDGKLGICFDIEGLAVLGGRLEMVQLYYDLGVRWALCVYNHANELGGGCLDAQDGGLTDFGRCVISEMNRVGMVVCASHAGYRTARDIIEASSQPVIFSHSNPSAVWASPRNIPDELMLTCARKGGVIGLNGIGPFLGRNDAATGLFVHHVVYALKLVGEDHVGIALDYCFGEENGLQDFMAEYPALFPAEHGCDAGMRMIAPWRLGEIASALSAQGLGAATLAKIFGGNHLRIAQTLWR
jgi:membrane dipeptidase